MQIAVFGAANSVAASGAKLPPAKPPQKRAAKVMTKPAGVMKRPVQSAPPKKKGNGRAQNGPRPKD